MLINYCVVCVGGGGWGFDGSFEGPIYCLLTIREGPLQTITMSLFFTCMCLGEEQG